MKKLNKAGGGKRPPQKTETSYISILKKLSANLFFGSNTTLEVPPMQVNDQHSTTARGTASRIRKNHSKVSYDTTVGSERTGGVI